MTRLERAHRLKGIYLVTDHGERLVERVNAALGQVCAVQFRSKEHLPEEKTRLGLALRDLCRSAGVLFIVNDDIALAGQLEADGVHLGQEDGDPREARQLLGDDRLVGISTHNLEEALAAQAAGADYIGFGAMYPTGSKDISHLPGPGLLAEARPSIAIPMVAIGGITRHNASVVIDAGADAIAVISAVMSRQSPGLAAAELKLLFNRRLGWPKGTVLTVAGSDSGGGAGIQADLKTITLLGSYGASVITALTAQNTLGVTGIQAATPEFVGAQLDAVLTDIPVDVVKTGMLYSGDIISVLAERIVRHRVGILIVDPVMIAKGGSPLMDARAIAHLTTRIIPMTYLLTPNIPEAEALTGLTINDDISMEHVAQALHRMGARNVLIKGGHGDSNTATDLLFDGRDFTRFPADRIETPNTHGTGCTLSSAIATFLAQGQPLPIAVTRAKKFVTDAIRLAVPMGQGHGPVNHFLAAQEQRQK